VEESEASRLNRDSLMANLGLRHLRAIHRATDLPRQNMSRYDERVCVARRAVERELEEAVGLADKNDPRVREVRIQQRPVQRS